MSACCQDKPSCSNSKAASLEKSMKIALVGNPNCGKTTLFNTLTGGKQRVGNWPGVTVEHKSGFYQTGCTSIEAIDLPGVYSLTLSSSSGAVDERIACEFIWQQQADVIINIVDASNLERHLYLTLQLLEMGAPVILVLNMIDIAQNRQIQINLQHLSHTLGCPVVAIAANKGIGIQELKKAICHYQPQQALSLSSHFPESIKQAIKRLTAEIREHHQQITHTDWLAMRLLEEDVLAQSLVNASVLSAAQHLRAMVNERLNEDADILLADSRYRYIDQIMQNVVHRNVSNKKTLTTHIDNVVLNRVLGVPIFLAVMYLLFFFAINIGGAFQDFFDISSQTIFVEGFAHLLTQLGAPNWLTVLLANGVGKGINTTVTFIPVIGAMFLFLALLEDSGYMARAAFVIDRFMRMLGLPGKAFVPMIVGFGCNVPAVMGARTLENKRDRILTIMMSPFMSCSARLAIYAVFTAAFFPHGGQNVVFGLYLIGIIMAILTGFILQKSLLKGEPSPLVMELPVYHVPTLNTIVIHAWQRLKGFVFRAGKLIVPICILIGVLNSLNIDGSMNTGVGDAHSLLSVVGMWVTPIFAPMGLHADNWPATVGLVTGILAKEVVVGTLNTLYSQMGHLTAASGDTFQFVAGLKAAWQSIPDNLAQLIHTFSNPGIHLEADNDINTGIYGLMYQKFDGQIGAFTYLLFVLLYFPCISTTAVMLRELHRGWSIFSVCWMTGVAYGTAVVFYQTATWMQHPWSSSIWIAAISLTFIATIKSIHWFAGLEGMKQMPSFRRAV